MAEFTLEVINKSGEILFKRTGKDEVTMAYRGLYNPGDKVVLTSSQKNIYVILRLGDSLETSFIYLKDYKAEFEIPFDKNRKPYGLKAFTEERHWAYARIARKYEIGSYKNLAKNTFDSKENRSMYPHAETNVTTEDPVFFAKNAIDGVFETCNHGSWPHSSWGINKQKDAWLKIDFGREVTVD
ncbi:MAG: carbohydrate-binding protein, partial [Clostridium sp.]|nr:carbohydrate-binding protein [Clostridium sp.]